MYTGTLAPVSNRETWSMSFELLTEPTRTPVDLTGCDVQIVVRSPSSRSDALYGALSEDDGTVVLDGAATLGKVIVTFGVDEMSGLCAGTYDVGVRLVTADGTTTQILAGSVPIVDGVFSR